MNYKAILILIELLFMVLLGINVFEMNGWFDFATHPYYWLLGLTQIIAFAAMATENKKYSKQLKWYRIYLIVVACLALIPFGGWFVILITSPAAAIIFLIQSIYMFYSEIEEMTNQKENLKN